MSRSVEFNIEPGCTSHSWHVDASCRINFIRNCAIRCGRLANTWLERCLLFTAASRNWPIIDRNFDHLFAISTAAFRPGSRIAESFGFRENWRPFDPVWTRFWKFIRGQGSLVNGNSLKAQANRLAVLFRAGESRGGERVMRLLIGIIIRYLYFCLYFRFPSEMFLLRDLFDWNLVWLNPCCENPFLLVFSSYDYDSNDSKNSFDDF